MATAYGDEILQDVRKARCSIVSREGNRSAMVDAWYVMSLGSAREMRRQLARSWLSLVFGGMVVHLGFMSAGMASPSSVKPVDVPAVSALRACKALFVAASDVKDEAQRQSRLESARSLCEAAERMQHSVEHLVWLAKVNKALGRIAEAREYWGRIIVETNQSAADMNVVAGPNEKAWRDEAVRELAPFSGPPVAYRAPRPETAVDLGRLTNPALPDDIARSAIEACAKDAIVAGKKLAGRIEVHLLLSDRGRVERVGVVILPAKFRDDDEPLSPALASCVEKNLRIVEVPREAGALPVMMSGRFMVLLGARPEYPGQTFVVSGRTREISP